MIINRVYLVCDRIFGSEHYAAYKRIPNPKDPRDKEYFRVLVDFPPQYGKNSFLVDFDVPTFCNNYEIIETYDDEDTEEFADLFDLSRLMKRIS